MKADKYYWMDSYDWIAVGEFDTEAQAREAAMVEATKKDNLERTYTILKALSVASPPTLKRTWKLV